MRRRSGTSSWFGPVPVERAYAEGVRLFVEAGPKRALQGFAEDVLGQRDKIPVQEPVYRH